MILFLMLPRLLVLNCILLQGGTKTTDFGGGFSSGGGGGFSFGDSGGGGGFSFGDSGGGKVFRVPGVFNLYLLMIPIFFQ